MPTHLYKIDRNKSNIDICMDRTSVFWIISFYAQPKIYDGMGQMQNENTPFLPRCKTVTGRKWSSQCWWFRFLHFFVCVSHTKLNFYWRYFLSLAPTFARFISIVDLPTLNPLKSSGKIFSCLICHCYS